MSELIDHHCQQRLRFVPVSPQTAATEQASGQDPAVARAAEEFALLQRNSFNYPWFVVYRLVPFVMAVGGFFLLRSSFVQDS